MPARAKVREVKDRSGSVHYGTPNAYSVWKSIPKEREMKLDRQIKVLLLAIVILLAVIAARPYVMPTTAYADSTTGFPVFIEPGVHMLRAPDNSQRVLGKVVVDLRNGNIWGFPTLQPDPYP